MALRATQPVASPAGWAAAAPDFGRKILEPTTRTQGAAAQNRDGIADWEQHLRGRVASAAQLNPSKAQRLQRWLGQVDWSS